MTVARREQRQVDGMRKGRLHVVVLPYPAKGHSIPLLHFAKQLHSMGVFVTFVNTFNHLSNEHFRSIYGANEDDNPMQVVPLGVTPPEGEGHTSLPYVNHVNTLVPETKILMTTLFARHEDAPPSCIVSDMFLGWTQEVANTFNIPKYVLFASPASGLAFMLHTSELVKQGKLPIDRSKEEDLVYDIPGVPPTRLADFPSPIQDPEDDSYLFYLRNCEQLLEAAGVLINTYYELEPTYIEALRKAYNLISFLPVGPLLPKAYFEPSSDVVPVDSDIRDPCLKWLDTQPDSSVLYVSFGSVAVLSIEQIQEIAQGLEASGQRFLLVLRPPSNPENVPLLPEGFEERTRGRGFVQVGWAPQLWVLSHRAVGGFLTHCGWNSTLESICRGVPMLAWPIQAEQAMNAR